MRKPTFKFVYWYSQRNANDGRRDSAIGTNKSKWHIFVGGVTVACGAKIQLWETYTEDETKILIKDFCKHCRKITFHI